MDGFGDISNFWHNVSILGSMGLDICCCFVQFLKCVRYEYCKYLLLHCIFCILFEDIQLYYCMIINESSVCANVYKILFGSLIIMYDNRRFLR
jgi:hypothetical protein